MLKQLLEIASVGTQFSYRLKDRAIVRYLLEDFILLFLENSEHSPWKEPSVKYQYLPTSFMTCAKDSITLLMVQMFSITIV